MEISSVTFFPRHTRITVRFHHHLYSSQVPELANTLLIMLPSLREHLCHNRKGRGILAELRDSELGHVFEHVVLAILHVRGLHVRGQTTWNWQRDPIGTYHVTVNTGKRLFVKESLLLAQAIFTNALLGPVLRFVIDDHGSPDPAQPLSLTVQSRRTPEPQRLLFSAEPAGSTDRKR